MERDLRQKRDTNYTDSGLNISKRSYNYKELAKAEQWRNAKMEREMAKK